MKSYEVTGKSAGLPPGALVRLTADQAGARKHNLELVEKTAADGLATYRIKNSIEFKLGEIFQTDCEMNKATAAQVQSYSEKAAAEKAAAEKEAADKAAAKKAAAEKEAADKAAAKKAAAENKGN